MADDFRRFSANYNIPGPIVSSISYRYRRITRQLNYDFWGSDSEIAHSMYVGSYGRDTAANGISDLDVAFTLPRSYYYQYDGHLFNGQSALLQAVKRSIQKTYRTSESFGDGQVVVVSFTDNITFEILPVFDLGSGSLTYPNANTGGSWKTTSPRAEIAAISARNALTNRNLKRLARMMRLWKAWNDVPMSGMLIDTLAYQFMASYPYRDKSFLFHDVMARDFFYFLSRQNVNQTIWRAPGSGSYVVRKGLFERKARSAYIRAAEAIAYDLGGYEWSRRKKWREVFGPLFPDA